MSKPKTDKPHFVHDCDTCVFLGTLALRGLDFDLYWHRPTKEPYSESFISRYGSNGPQYGSGVPFSYGQNFTLTRAREIAEAEFGRKELNEYPELLAQYKREYAKSKHEKTLQRNPAERRARRNPETPEQAAQRIRDWYAVHPQIRDQELADIQRQKIANAKMEAAGYISAPDGGWVKKSVWRAHMRTLAKRQNPAKKVPKPAKKKRNPNTTSSLQFYAQPYSSDCEGFYFSTVEEYETQQAKSHCEEYEIQFIDGTSAECDLFKAIDRTFPSIAAVYFLEKGGADNESEAAAVYYVIQYNGEDDLDAAIKWAEDEGRPRQGDMSDLTHELVDELGIESFNNPHFYIDYEALGRDLLMDWDEDEQGPEPDDPEKYAEEFVDDVGLQGVQIENYIDWDKLTNDVGHDYTEFEFADQTWTIRND